jgi:hypothetical protein
MERQPLNGHCGGLERDLFPWIGSRAMTNILELLAAFRR